MRRLGIALFLMALGAGAQLPPEAPRTKKLLAIGATRGYQHDSVSHALATLWKIGRESGLWETWIRTDTAFLTKKKPERNAKNLDDFDAVFFYTTGELDLDAEQKAALLAFVRDEGKGFLGSHSATDTFYTWPEYGDLIGGYFDHHPWHQKVGVTIEDRTFPATRHFPLRIEIADEIYQFRNWSRDRVRVLMSIDNSTVDLKAKNVHRTDGDFAVTWVRPYGKGRVFYSSLGHREEVWNRPDIQKMWLEAVKWTMGMTQGELAPRRRPSG